MGLEPYSIAYSIASSIASSVVVSRQLALKSGTTSPTRLELPHEEGARRPEERLSLTMGRKPPASKGLRWKEVFDARGWWYVLSGGTFYPGVLSGVWRDHGRAEPQLQMQC